MIIPAGSAPMGVLFSLSPPRLRKSFARRARPSRRERTMPRLAQHVIGSNAEHAVQATLRELLETL